ncbi:hypothetical protein M0R45_002481 [Rubus argutus]|uniref:Uncharacterized protein n=1 Tax=Rubus argutus TaxID=59490 RepID=A0AAW1VRF9_RUBAR
MDVVTVIRPPLPDLVIDQILRILPTKAAVRMSSLSKQWDGVWRSASILDFDEGDEPGKYDNDHIDLNKILEHRKFIKIVERCLKFREIYQHKQDLLLYKFRLRMMRYLPGDYDIIDNCLSFVFERSIKELDISLRISRLYRGFAWQNRLELYYCISRMTLVNAKSVTVLNLEYVRIKDLESYKPSDTRLLPNLKTLSLKNVHFEDHVFPLLIWECPSLEYLSLNACSFEFSEFNFSGSSLKSLEVKHSNAWDIRISHAENLESFRFSSNSSLLETIILNESCNLKYINVHAEHLKQFSVNGCRDCLMATINTPNLVSFFFKGFLKSKVFVKAPNLSATFLIWDLWDGDLLALNGPWRHYLTLRDFLERIGCSKNVILYIRDFKTLIFPEDFRKNFSSPLYGCNQLFLRMDNSPEEVKDMDDFYDSLVWMAPSTTG